MLKHLFFFIVCSSTLSMVAAQVTDDFSDGDLSANPPWSGDLANFIVNDDAQLQLSAPAVAEQSYLVTESDIINEAEWNFYVRLAFNPSSNNYLDIYLVSDAQNLKDALNGYFVRIGNTQDEVSLYKQRGDKSSAVKIIDGMDDRVDRNNVEIRVKVTKGLTNEWHLSVDADLSGNYLAEGSVVDAEHVSSTYFGLLCNYTSSRSKKIYFDDLSITGSAFSDPDPPEVDSVLVLSDSVLQIAFNERLEPTSAMANEHYFINHDIGYPAEVVMPTDTTVRLIFDQKFQDRLPYEVSIDGVQDLYGNVLSGVAESFVYYAPYVIQFGDLIVSEIMADPSPEVDLPAYEFLEIFNRHTERLDVEGFFLEVGNDLVALPEFTIDSSDYLILCPGAAVEQFASFGKVLHVPNWPTLNNRGERVTLYDGGNGLIFSAHYDDSWYRSIEKDDGGWSLEMLDTGFPCKGSENWSASTDPAGGTPGRENAARQALTDLQPPDIVSAFAIDAQRVLVQLTEPLTPEPLDTDQISTSPVNRASSVQVIYPERQQIEIEFIENIVANTTYSLTISSLEDCPGNIRDEAGASFVLPDGADSLDIIINEVLFNPWHGGVDFVEVYNQSEKYIDLKGWALSNTDTSLVAVQHYILAPGQFLAITEDYDVLSNQYPGIDRASVLEVARLTPLNNDAGDVRLMDMDEKTVDFFQYSEDYHSTFIRDPEGVSLERVSFDAPSNSPDNWQSAAETAGFATPGQMNSQHVRLSASYDAITVEPKVFDPGMGGSGNFVLITCRFNQPGNMANIRIVDAYGRSVKEIASHQSISTEEQFKWEGDSDSGYEVRMGYYIVYAEIYDAMGARRVYRKKVVVGGRLR
jgi:hypothetical protein